MSDNPYNILNLTTHTITLIVNENTSIEFPPSKYRITLTKNNCTDNFIEIANPSEIDKIDNNDYVNILRNIRIPVVEKRYTINGYDFRNIPDNTIPLVNNMVANEICNNNVNIDMGDVPFILSPDTSNESVVKDKNDKNKIIGTKKFIRWNIIKNKNENEKKFWFF
jgi:hypothetical protein